MPEHTKGFALLASAILMLALAGMAGLAIDVGHLYAVRSEAQAYADSLALTGAAELDGTPAGSERARQRMASIPRKGFLRIGTPPAVDVAYSSDQQNWQANPAQVADARAVRVQVWLPAVDLFFLPAVTPQRTAAIRTVSVAAQTDGETAIDSGLLPFAIFAAESQGPDFGYREGEPVTLRWSGNGTGCGSRQIAGASANAGYIQGPSRDAVREAIEDGLVSTPVEQNASVRMSGGEREVQSASLLRRANQDTNVSAKRYSEYVRTPGNGRRIATAPIVSSNLRVAGFVEVFLPAQQPAGENEPLCAEYVGRSSLTRSRQARLVQ